MNDSAKLAKEKNTREREKEAQSNGKKSRLVSLSGSRPSITFYNTISVE